MLDVFEDGERLLPGLPCLREITGDITGVTEVGEGVRFNPAVTEFPGDVERVFIAGDGFGKVAQMMLGVAQAVPRMALTSAVASFCTEGE